jgi:hypothetical protein
LPALVPDELDCSHAGLHPSPQLFEAAQDRVANHGQTLTQDALSASSSTVSLRRLASSQPRECLWLKLYQAGHVR